METHLYIYYETISFNTDRQYCTIICIIVSSHYTILYNIFILSVTLSTTETYIDKWTSTEYGYQIYSYYNYWYISFTSCYNTLISSYICYYSNTYKAWCSATWSSTSMSYYTRQSYTATSTIIYSSTLKISNSPTYTNSQIISITIINTDIYTITYSLTDIQYSTITRMLAPSPSPMNKCTCIIPLCNKLDLVLLTINNII
jgi:hypothetical protein